MIKSDLNKNNLCWICRDNPANSNEHMFKKSVLKLMYGNQFNNFVKTADFNSPVPVQSIGSDELTYRNIICTTCNNQSTSDHDRAFHVFTSKILSSLDRLVSFGEFDITEMFYERSNHLLVWLQLYFVKILGCEFKEYLRKPGAKEKINLSKFGSSILKNKASSKISLCFGFHRVNLKGKPKLNSLELDCLFRPGGRNIIKAKWFFTFGNLVYAVKYSEVPEYEKPWWSPSLKSNTVNFVDFTDLYTKRILNREAE